MARDIERRKTPGTPADREVTWHEKVVHALSNWHFWVVLWGFALVAVVAFTLVTYSREASDRAARQASEEAQRAQCVNAIPFTRRVNRFIVGVRQVGEVLLGNSKRMHAITPPGTKLYQTQAYNIRKLHNALESQKNLTVPVATQEECRILGG